MAIYDINGTVLSSGSSGGSPIDGKRIAIIGDSNMQYSGDTIKAYLEETYGCSVTILAKAGYAWEYTGSETIGENVPTTDASAVGRVNSIIANVDSNKLITEYDYVIFMMGTNLYTLGELTDTSDSISTMCGAMRYCMEKMCYYGRQIKLGVIIPLRNDLESYNLSASEMPTKFEYIKEIARQYAVPTLNIWDEGRIIPNAYTPDGTSYYLGDSVHLGGNGTMQFKHILGKWIAYQL